MPIDLAAASSFMTTHARPLERRWFSHLTADRDPDGVVSALDAHRNHDGGYGWAIEPDLRAPDSQPAGALHAFEVLEALPPGTGDRARSVCDWLGAVTLADGGLPFALPIDDPTGTAPFWAGADPTASSLHITTALAGSALRLARHDPLVGGHPWVQRATAFCLDAIGRMDAASHAIELKYVLQFLDAATDRAVADNAVATNAPSVVDLLDRFATAIPASGSLHVEGGLDDEMMRPLDFSPEPNRPLRERFAPSVVIADLERLASLQQPDGGWTVDYRAYSPAAELDWRCLATVRAVTLLRANE